jgi:hypothetical protein
MNSLGHELQVALEVFDLSPEHFDQLIGRQVVNAHIRAPRGNTSVFFLPEAGAGRPTKKQLFFGIAFVPGHELGLRLTQLALVAQLDLELFRIVLFVCCH